MSQVRIRILIADDHTLVREGTRQILEEAPDIEVVGEAARGDEAVRMAEELRPAVVLMDIRMPGLNGIEAARAVIARSPGSRVLFLSAFDDDAFVAEALGAGAAGYLLKTAQGRELVEAVRAVHAGATVLQDSLSRRLAQRSLHHGAPSSRLSDRELGVLRQVARGISSKEIATHLGISQRTVDGHLNNIFAKLGVASRTEAVVQAASHGLISLESA